MKRGQVALAARTIVFAAGVVTLGVLTTGIATARPDNLPEPAMDEMFPEIDIQQAVLGQSLFFDPILAGNENIACSTCHHPTLGTSDGMSLSIGEGGVGLGPDRRLGTGEHVYARIPRNAPALWNRGATGFHTMFHDGRLQLAEDRPFGVLMPPARDLERAVMSPLAAQALLPVTSADEMAGQHDENDTASRAEKMQFAGADGAWVTIAARVEAVPAYRAAFDRIIGPDEPIHITDIANALASFMTFEFRSTDSPFDAYLRGDETALTDLQTEGMELFYGTAGCSACHSGTFQTDQSFHAMGMPQIGPGKAHVADRIYADIGRMAVTGDPADAYKFRTPSLRNVTLTAPYTHAGAYATLEAVIRHHMDPQARLADYDITQALLHTVDTVHADNDALMDAQEMARISAAIEFDGVEVTEDQIPALIAFLGALEDPVAKGGRLGVPAVVLSGLPMDEVTLPVMAVSQDTAETPAVSRDGTAAVLRAAVVDVTPAAMSAGRSATKEPEEPTVVLAQATTEEAPRPPVMSNAPVTRDSASVTDNAPERAEVPLPDRGYVQPADVSIRELMRVSAEITAKLSE